LVVPVCEEKVTVDKRDTDVMVTVRKVVKTEQVNVPLSLRRETVVVERLPGGSSDECKGEFGEKQFTIQLKREIPVIEKKVVSAGRVVVKKRTATITKQVSEVSRKEEVVVENAPQED
jgi:stress response protein YsnF